jgi:hypothetical protein
MHFALRERFTALAREAKPPFHANRMADAAGIPDLRAAGSETGRKKPRFHGVH